MPLTYRKLKHFQNEIKGAICDGLGRFNIQILKVFLSPSPHKPGLRKANKLTKRFSGLASRASEIFSPSFGIGLVVEGVVTGGCSGPNVVVVTLVASWS